MVRSPIGVALSTGDALSRIELSPHDNLYFASADLKDAFYHLELPHGIRHLFGLRGVRAGDIGLESLRGKPVPWHQTVFPQLSAVPMGWSWALYLCQTLHERIVGQVGADDALRLSDKKPAPDSRVLHTEYVDNFHVIGTDEQAVSQLSQTGIAALRDSGLVVHEEEQSMGSAQILGWEFSSDGTLRPTTRRLWKVRLAILHVLKSGRISGQQLERVIGHMSFISMVRREGLSILGDCYTFIQRHYYLPAKLWKSVRRELTIWYGIAPLLWKDLTAEWSSTIYATDASDWGSGVTTSTMDIQQVQQLGRYAERWRFKDDRWRNPRRSSPSLFSADEADDVVAHGWDQQHDDAEDRLPNRSGVQFQPLPFSAVDRSWKVVGRWKWLRQESMPILEARATLFAVKHMVRSSSNFGKRMLVFSDSMTAVSSISRGRAHARGLRRVVQQISALCLCSSVCLHTRWCPSEWNPADSPSRGGWKASTPQRHLGHGDPPVPGCEAFSSSKPVIQPETKQNISSKDSTSCSLDACTTAGATDRATVVVSDSGDKSNIPSPLESVLKLVTSDGVSTWQQRRGRQSPDAVSRGVLPGRKRLEFGSICGGGCNVCSAGSAEPSDAEVARHKAKSSGMAQFVPTSEPLAGSLGSGLFGERVGLQAEALANGSGVTSDVCYVPAASRTLQAESQGCCLPKCEIAKTPSKDCGDFAQLRGRHSVKDTRVRRDHRARPGPPPVPDPDASEHDFEVAPPEGQFPFQPRGKSDPGLPARRPNEAAHQQHRTSPSLSVETWRSQHGLLGKAQGSGVNTEAGSMAGNGVRQKIREGGAFGTASQQAPRYYTGVGHVGKRKHRRGLLQPAPATAHSLTTPCFLELFSGSGHLSKAVHQVTSWNCITWDILHGSEYDLRSSAKRKRILNWIKSGMVQAVHLGTPCCSFSRARDRRPGPPPLRSDSQPLGFSDLGFADMVKVREGNLWMRFSAQVFNLCMKLHIPVTMENPFRSRIWLCPPIKHLLRRKQCYSVDVDYCAFGTRWRKRTKFLYYGVNLEHLGVHRCCNSKRGICAFSGKPHLQLMGVTKSGVFMTKLAEPYPVQLYLNIAHAFLDWHTEVIANNFWRRLWPDSKATMGG